MPRPHVKLHTSAAALRAGFDRVRSRFGVSVSFPREVDAAAAAARVQPAERDDYRSTPFITIDPAGSRDLDQAFYAEPVRGGYRVLYAIADVAAFVEADDLVGAEALRRGETLYLPDERAPLYPYSLGEGKASLLPGEDRPALVWTLDLDDRAELRSARVTRALVHSRRALSYLYVQQALEHNRASREMRLLKEIGQARQQIEADRGGVSLNLPSQEIVRAGDHYALEFRAALAVEGWNAQISLLTGMAAAQLMVAGGVGLLRTLPSVDDSDIAQLRAIAADLGIDWLAQESYSAFIRRLDPGREPAHAALVTDAARTLRGAGYLAWHGTGAPPEHGALRTIYAHVTAPLRRLADRYANEIVLAQSARKEIPPWVMAGLERLPDVMAASRRRAHDIERACLDLMEAALLANRVGETFAATVVDRRGDRLVIHIADPAVVATVESDHVEPGQRTTVRLDAADPETATVAFSVVRG